MNGTADGVLWEEGNGENCSVAMEEVNSDWRQLTEWWVCDFCIQQYRIVTVIIIELQNIKHMDIKWLKNLADMNRYVFSWKLKIVKGVHFILW